MYRSYYPHRSRDSLSPVCGIFSFNSFWIFFVSVLLSTHVYRFGVSCMRNYYSVSVLLSQNFPFTELFWGINAERHYIYIPSKPRMRRLIEAHLLGLGRVVEAYIHLYSYWMCLTQHYADWDRQATGHWQPDWK